MDYPYVILLLILLFFAYQEWKHPSLSDSFFKCICWVVFVFIAFRAPVVGADTWNYYRFATGVRNFYNNDERELEILYQWYNDFFRRYCPLGLLFMVVNTLIIFSPIRYILKKYVKRKVFGVLIFFLIFQFSPFFVALRQVLSLSIILWGVIYVLENRKYKWFVYIALSLCAWLMHTTGVIVASLFLAAYFIPLKSRIIPIVAVCISTFIGIILEKFNVLGALDFFLSLDLSATERLSGYLGNQELNELSNFNIILRTPFIALIAFIFMDEKKIDNWFSKIYLIGIVLFCLFYSVPMISRIVMANTMFVIVVLPWIFEGKSFIVTKRRRFVNGLLLVIVLYFSRSYILSNIDYDLTSSQRMHPYYFFFENYSNHPSILYFK